LGVGQATAKASPPPVQPLCLESILPCELRCRKLRCLPRSENCPRILRRPATPQDDLTDASRSRPSCHRAPPRARVSRRISNRKTRSYVVAERVTFLARSCPSKRSSSFLSFARAK